MGNAWCDKIDIIYRGLPYGTGIKINLKKKNETENIFLFKPKCLVTIVRPTGHYMHNKSVLYFRRLDRKITTVGLPNSESNRVGNFIFSAREFFFCPLQYLRPVFVFFGRAVPHNSAGPNGFRRFYGREFCGTM